MNQKIVKTVWLICSFLLTKNLIGQEVDFSIHPYAAQFVEGTATFAKCSADMNNDGLDDFTRISPLGINIDYQNKDGYLNHILYPMSISTPPFYSINAGDLNGDGYNDLLFGGKEHVSFLLYDPIGHQFREQVMPQKITCQRATLFDIDVDGDLDAFVCNDAGKSLVFENDGMGNMVLNETLIDTSPLAGNYSAIWVDIDSDDDTDLYISKCLAETSAGDPRRTNLLYKNNGNGDFLEMGAQAGLNDNAQSWCTVFEDFDHDGDFDAFIVNHDEFNRLYRNNGDGTFTDVINSSGIDNDDLGAYENSSGDFNNDGHMDILSELNNSLYLGNGDLTFNGQKLPLLPNSIGDYNNDGHLDFTSRNTLCINRGNSNHYIKITLKGVESNINGIGSKVMVKTRSLMQIKELRSGESYSPMHSLNLHFGLGQDTIIESLTIKWPSGITTNLFNLHADSNYVFVESPCLLSDALINSSKLNSELCPNEIITLSIDNKFAKYNWNTGDSTNMINIKHSGSYQVIFEDSSGCRGYSQIQIIDADTHFDRIDDNMTNLLICDGEKTVLKSKNNSKVYWSTLNYSESIEVSEPGYFFFTQDSICNEGKFISDTVVIKAINIKKPELSSIQYIGDSIFIEVSGEECAWFENINDTTSFYNGCTLRIRSPLEDKVFFVESRGKKRFQTITCGRESNEGFKNVSNIPRKMYFTLHDSIVLESIDIYKKFEINEPTKINIVSLEGNILQFTHNSIGIGRNTLLINGSLGRGAYYISTNDTSLYMNIGPMDYPYPIGNIGSIDSANISFNFYPYFYNWKVRKVDDFCTSDRLSIPIDVVNTVEINHGFKVFPNPVTELINFEFFNDDQWVIEIYNIFGQKIIELNNLVGRHLNLPISQLSSALYLVKLTNVRKNEIYTLIVNKQ